MTKIGIKMLLLLWVETGEKTKKKYQNADKIRDKQNTRK